MNQAYMIDLRSDTVTKPTPAMRQAMAEAEVGDDVFNEDPSLNYLEEKAARWFGHEAAIFCPSGTMTNQLAIRTHTQVGDEIICAKNAHVYRYEGGGPAVNAGVSVYPVDHDRGVFSPEAVEDALTPDDVHKPQSRLVVVENTSNKGGGHCWSLEEMLALRRICDKKGLKLHLDGARLFNALVAQGLDPQTVGSLFDSVSVCLSKGLGAPVGSLLLGDFPFIQEAHRSRKVMGGGMRQAGHLAAAASYAMDYHYQRLADDHQLAQLLAQNLREQPYIDHVMPVETNIIIGKLRSEFPLQHFLDQLKDHGILAVPFGPQQFRMVTHLDIDDEAIAQVNQFLTTMQSKAMAQS